MNLGRIWFEFAVVVGDHAVERRFKFLVDHVPLVVVIFILQHADIVIDILDADTRIVQRIDVLGDKVGIGVALRHPIPAEVFQ